MINRQLLRHFLSQYRAVSTLGLCLLLISYVSPLHAEANKKQRITNHLGMEFIPIPAGSFVMGTADLDEVVFELPDGDASLVKDETPAHKVTISKPFHLSKTEVTQQQWLTLMGNKPGPDSHWQRKNWQQLAAVSINWNMTQAFIRELNKVDKNYRYRLPTEAEWEYAARAGSTGARPFPSEDLGKHAWYLKNSNDEIQAVGQRVANAWGLHDMLGNAWEWVNDNYAPDSYQNHTAVDPQGAKNGSKKVRRGGSYHCQPHLVRPAYRAADTPTTGYSVLGFRLVMEKK